MTSSSDDPLLLSTLRSRSTRPSTPPRAKLPCLTILGHPERARIGERAPLKALLLGQAVEVSRAQPSFGRAGSLQQAPLHDRHVSRTPFRVRPAASGLTVEPNGTGLHVGGEPLIAPRTFGSAELELGVVLELEERVLLLLHYSSHRPPTELGGLIGQSDAIDALRCEIANVADLDTPVLVRGETGTGKELVAQAIHAASARREGRCVAVNMAAVPESTAVSTLFGHARGAFTGAHQRHEGVFERAAGGTLLLDEIGETPECVQPMLLRAIETRRILPLGESSERAVDVRLLAATDADLERDLDEHSFSAALLHRLSGYELHVPPLRARREDIPLLLLHFIDQELETTGEQSRAGALLALLLESRFLSRVVRHPLPGNVRQLRNLARHLVISNRGQAEPSVTSAMERVLGERSADALVSPSMRPSALPPPPPLPRVADVPGATQAARAAEITDARMIEALREHGWSPNRAAASLGIATGTLHDMMRRSGQVRRAADLSDEELRAAHAATGGETRAMADRLCVSERALRITLRQRGLAELD
jgi:two-component system nitrogen regulation response regulator GlnG